MTEFSTETLPQKRTTSILITAVRAIELVLFSAAVIYSIITMFKGAGIVSFTSSSCDFLLSSLRKSVSVFKGLLSSPLVIGIFMNFIVLLIWFSSFFHRPQLENNNDEGGDADGNNVHEDFDDLQSTLSPSLSPPPPMKYDQEKAKTTAVAAEGAAATMETAAMKGDFARSEIKSSASALKNQHQQETVEVAHGVRTGSEVHQEAIFSAFSKFAKVKEIKRNQTTVDGGKIRTSEQLKRDTNIAKVTKHYSLKAPDFADLPKLADTKEIKKAHSLDSAKEACTIPNPEDTIANYGEIGVNESQNQANNPPENEDHWDEDDTMEATWRAINGGTKPQEKQLKKSETWPQKHNFDLPDDEYSEEIHVNMEDEEMPEASLSAKELRKSMTFNDTDTIRRRGGLIREDPSMNLEEFNKKVEAFIHNFIHEMRLQRQESDQRYLDMIKRGL